MSLKAVLGTSFHAVTVVRNRDNIRSDIEAIYEECKNNKPQGQA